MPSDRGTLPRGSARSGLAGNVLTGSGSAGSGGQRPTWQEPTAPAGRRLPSAPRERKPALAALAVLLIIGGALGAGFLVIQSGKRVAAIEISQQIGAGQRIPLSAMQQVQIAAGSGLAYVPWDQAAQVARFYAVSTIPPGTLLTNEMVATTSTSVAGKALLGLALKDGQLPHGLQDGDHVDIYQVSDAQETCPGSSGGALAANAIVLAIGAPSADLGQLPRSPTWRSPSTPRTRERWPATPRTGSWASRSCPTAAGRRGRRPAAGRRGRGQTRPTPAPGSTGPGTTRVRLSGAPGHRGAGDAVALIAVAADKGAPGVTTTAVALAAVWPRPVLLAECDPAGGDLVYRLPGEAAAGSTRGAGCSAWPWRPAATCSRPGLGRMRRSCAAAWTCCSG